MDLEIPKIFFDKRESLDIEVLTFKQLGKKLSHSKNHDPFVAHKIEFFLILIITKNSYSHFVDFKSYTLKEGSALFIAKNQVHITHLYNQSKYDPFKIIKGLTKSIFRPMQPLDFKDVALSISKKQGKDLVQLIEHNNLKNIVEFGTSFGISTLFLAQGAITTKGHIITTELIESKALKATENFKKAGVSELIEVRIGDALHTLKNHNEPVDLLLLDGWKNLYLPLFQMLEATFHENTLIYVDNADMADVQLFLKTVAQNHKYRLQSKFGGKVVLVTIKK